MSEGMTIFLMMIFATVFLLMQGLVIPVFGEGAKTRKQLKKKLAEIEHANDSESYASVLREKYLRKLSPLERQLEEIPVMEALSVKIEQAGHGYLAYRLVLFSIILSLTGAVVAWNMTNMWYAPIVAGLFLVYLPFMKINFDKKRRFAKFEEQLPDAIDTMTRALKAGHPFSATLKMVADDFQDPVAGEFNITFGDLNYGNDSRKAMLGLLTRVPSVTVMALVTSVLVQKETGGNLAEVLSRISAVIRGRYRFFRKVKTLSAEGRMSAWVLAMVPLVLFAVISITTPDYLPTLVNDPRGHNMIYYSCVSGFIGIIWIRKLLRIEV